MRRYWLEEGSEIAYDADGNGREVTGWYVTDGIQDSLVYLTKEEAEYALKNKAWGSDVLPSHHPRHSSQKLPKNDTRLQVKLSSELKADYEAWCAKQGTTPTADIRQYVASRVHQIEVHPGGNWRLYWGAGPLPEGAISLGVIQRGPGDSGALLRLDSGNYVQGNAGVIRDLDPEKVEKALREAL